MDRITVNLSPLHTPISHSYEVYSDLVLVFPATPTLRCIIYRQQRTSPWETKHTVPSVLKQSAGKKPLVEVGEEKVEGVFCGRYLAGTKGLMDTALVSGQQRGWPGTEHGGGG